MISKPRSFNDLLYLQKLLDNEISKPRKNGFVPRKKNDMDILSALDDEFQEWQKELPYEYNFKTWKQKEYSREKELEEFVDILFFFLQYVNYKAEFNYCIVEIFTKLFNRFCERKINSVTALPGWIEIFKEELWGKEVYDSFEDYFYIASVREFDIDEILETYWKKWQINIKRINSDWVIQE